MEVYEEIVWSLISILLALLIGKIASASAARDATRHVELREMHSFGESVDGLLESLDVLGSNCKIEEACKEDAVAVDDELVKSSLEEKIDSDDELVKRSNEASANECEEEEKEIVERRHEGEELVKSCSEETDEFDVDVGTSKVEKRFEVEREIIVARTDEEFVKSILDMSEMEEFHLPLEMKKGEKRFEVQSGEVLSTDLIGCEFKEGGEIIIQREDDDEELRKSSLEELKEQKVDEIDVEEERNVDEKKFEVNEVVVEENSAKQLVKRECESEIGKGEKNDIDEKRFEVDSVESLSPVLIEMKEEELVKKSKEVKVEEIEVEDERNLDEMKFQANEEENSAKQLLESEIEKEEKNGIDEEGTLLCGEDEWEGIEKSELQKLFGVAKDYTGSATGENAISKLSTEVQKQLYGLDKVATEGTCYEPQPLALKVWARAKWHAWQRLGSMNPEVAMEQYITLLSKSIPGWMGEKTGVDGKHEGHATPDVGVSGTGIPDSSSFMHIQLTSGAPRVLEEPSCLEVNNATTSPKHFEQGRWRFGMSDIMSVLFIMRIMYV